MHVIVCGVHAKTGQKHFSAVTWLMIKNWTGVSIQSLIGEGINDATNAILMCRNGHDLFGEFSLYFEPTVSAFIHGKMSYPKTI